MVYASTHGNTTWTPLATDSTQLYASGEVVVAATRIDRFRALYLANFDTNGWKGSVEYSLDGGSTWGFLFCLACDRGNANIDAGGRSGAIVSVDGNDDANDGTTCKNLVRR